MSCKIDMGRASHRNLNYMTELRTKGRIGSLKMNHFRPRRRRLGFLFDQLFAVGGLVGGDNFFDEFVGDVVVVGKFHGVGGTALRFRDQVVRVGEHFRERHLRFDDYVVAAQIASGDAAAPAAQVTHQVSRILVGGIDFDVHHRLKQHRPGLLHSFLEGQRAGDLESDVRGVDIVVFAVVENGAEINHWEAGEITARGGFANSSFHGGNPVPWYRAAENVVDELDALPALDGLHFDATDAKLAVPAGLFLVLAFGIGLAANGFAVGNFGRLEREVDVIAFVQLGDDDFDVLLA